jgi:hypothetical protein
MSKGLSFYDLFNTSPPAIERAQMLNKRLDNHPRYTSWLKNEWGPQRAKGNNVNAPDFSQLREEFNKTQRELDSGRDPVYQNEYTYKELLAEIDKVIRANKERLGRAELPEYRGEKTAPMSMLMQKARELEDRYATKPSPYSRKIGQVLGRPKAGFNTGQETGLRNITAREAQLMENEFVNQMKEEFGTHYTPDLDYLKRRLGQNTDQC